MFLSRFIVSNIFSMVMVGMILLLKRLFNHKISRSFHYHMWIILMFSIGIICFPTHWIQTNQFSHLVQELTAPQVEKSESIIMAPDMPEDWRVDVSEMIDTSRTLIINRVLVMIWGVGVIGILAFYYLGNRKLRSIKRFSEGPSKEIKDLFDNCYRTLDIKRRIVLLQSDLVASPMSFRCQHTYIILPKKEMHHLSSTQVEHVLLHELMHFKHKDIMVNLLSCVIQMIYWFNPLIWWAFSKMRLDQEVYCDWAVLNHYYSEEERLGYGETLIHFARQRSTPYVYTANQLIKNKNQIKYRIGQIVSFNPYTRMTKIAGYLLSILLAIVVMGQVPVLASLDMHFGLSYKPDESLHIIEHNEKDIFGENHGSAVIYDMETNIYDVYNRADITKRIAPCSTYKIYSAINALEQGIITPSDNRIKWDNILRGISEWNQDQNLNTAFKYSVNWYFQFLDQKSSISELSEFYSSIGYGNGYVGNDPNYYWNGGSLKISPLEQVQLLVKLYRNDFQFHEMNIDVVKQALFISDHNGNKIYGKTGTGRNGCYEISGWFIGYVETNTNKTYFFAVNLQNKDHANGNAAIKITQEIFKEMGIKINTTG